MLSQSKQFIQKEIDRLTAENTRLDAEWKQAHKWNNELVAEHYTLTAERDALREENGHRLAEIDRLRAVIKDDSEANSRERDALRAKVEALEEDLADCRNGLANCH